MRMLMLFLLFVFLNACGTIHYRSDGKIPITFHDKIDHTRPFEVTTSKEFYLFGLVPRKHQFYIDAFFSQLGIIDVSRLKIQEYSTPLDNFLTILSLGFYTRRTLILSGTTKYERY
jgi:hypothetical protein